jgi:hypothetical protein
VSFTSFITALCIPADARVDQRVPKKLLIEQGSPTTADKRQIQDGVDEIIWVAALKPTNIGVPIFRDDVREYLEIAVITVKLRSGAKANRLNELIHRAIPYPVVLITETDNGISFSLAHKRWSQGEIGKVVIEDIRFTNTFRPDTLTEHEMSFMSSIAVANLPSGNLFALYQGWFDRIAALEAAQITGAYTPPNTGPRASQLRDGLDTHTRLQRQIAILRAQAAKEKQINRRAELNLEVNRLQSELKNIIENL